MKIPFLRPDPPDLRELGSDLEAVRSARVFSNNGPFNSRFERSLQDTMFADGGACVTVCNATIGLMLAIRAVVDRADRARNGRSPPGPRFALMPSFTFAAAAMAAEWAGLVPLFCDVDPQDWCADAAAEEAAIAEYGDRIAVMVPYAAFGNDLDLARYRAVSERTGIPVVVDAAASLGSLDRHGRAFGGGCSFPVVYSMHATKTFSTGEGGVIHSADAELCRTLRVMGNFGFGAPRSATMIGLNAKLTEVGAILALARLGRFESVVRHRERLAARYRDLLPGFGFQHMRGRRTAHQFMPLLVPAEAAGLRDALRDEVLRRGVGIESYFCPHVAEQPHFSARGLALPLPVTRALAERMLSLPLWDEMTETMVDTVADVVLAALEQLTRTSLPFAGRLAAHLAVPVPDTLAQDAVFRRQVAL